MSTNAVPESTDQYFQSFGAYLRTGDVNHLNEVFPQAENLTIAAVYRNGFLRSSISALRTSYPVVEMLVGKEYFDFLAKAYVKQYPPTKGTFIGYGEQFPEYLAAEQKQHQLAYLSDFARLDRAWLKAYFAEDSELLSEQDVESWQAAGNDIGALGSCLPKSATLLALEFKISSLWLTLKEGEKPGESIQIPPEEEQLLVWRNSQNQVNVRVNSTAELAFLARLVDGSTLALAAATALEAQNNFPVIDYFSELLDTDVLAVN